MYPVDTSIYLNPTKTMRRRRKKGKIEDLVEKELYSLLIEHEPLDNKNFNKREINVNKTDDTIPIVKEYETII